MPFTPPHLVIAAAALAGLTLAVYLLQTVAGVIARLRGAVSADYVRSRAGPPPPEWLGNIGRNFANLCELPVLFYPLAMLAVFAGHTADGVQTWLGWGFVASRYLHTLVHVTTNAVALRFLFHRIGFVLLCVMWARFVMLWPDGG